MENKFISTRSNAVLSYFHKRDQDCFTYSEAHGAIPDSSEGALKELLSDMVRRGLLMRIRKGVYYIIPYEQNADSYMPDWHLLAEHLARGIKHYIGYYSALQIHNLITQPSLKEQIVVAKQVRPSVLRVRDVEFQFIFHNENHFFGFKKMWIDSFNQVYCSDQEKTFIDCLFRPDYAGGIVEISKAIYMAQDKIKFDNLLEYCRKFNSQAVIKRLGFILEMLEINTGITEELQKAKTASYVVLDTELPRYGKMISRWGILQNLETETIKSAIFT